MKIQSVYIDLSQSKSVTTAFKSDYNRLKGVFITGSLSDPVALAEIKVNSKSIVSDEKFPAQIIAANENLSWKDVVWAEDMELEGDNISISFDTTSTDKIYINFIVE